MAENDGKSGSAGESETQATEGPRLRLAVLRLLKRPFAFLGTLAERDGRLYPAISLVMPAIGKDGRPLLLLSDLSDHARNLASRPEMSLLFENALDRPQPLTGPRVTLLGEAAAIADSESRADYIRQRPEAGAYADFGDFRLYHCRIREARFVAGFGRIHRLDEAELFPAPPEDDAASPS